MGAPKMLLRWGRTSVLGHLVAQWKTLGARQVAVVCAVNDQSVRAELDRILLPERDRIFNPAPEGDMFSSIQCAARWAGWESSLTNWAIVLGDQPHLSEGTLQALIDYCAAHPRSICQPRYAGHRHHPVFLPKSILAAAASTKAANLKEFLQTMGAETLLCELDDPALALDIDRPEDYRLALAKYAPNENRQ